MSRTLCTFRLQGKLFGVEVSRVQEVLRAQTLTSIPRAPGIIAGLINLRGQIVLVLELRQLFTTEVTKTAAPTFVVLRTEDGPVALGVDEIGDVIEAQDSNFEDVPASEDSKGLVQSAYKLPTELLLLLNTEALPMAASNSKEELN
jgi:purine-binding chemotaxis protein CheW